MFQTEARKILKDAPIMWRRINSIGIILDCNSTYANKLGYAKSEILGKTIFEHVPKESWEAMNDSLKTWFETGNVSDRKIMFKKHDSSTFPGLLHATSLYDERGSLLGSNTVIFDLTEINDKKIKELEEFFTDAKNRLDEIKNTEYKKMDKDSKSEYDGLEKMFDMLASIDLEEFKEQNK
jgi:PAS domain S-box-containing protein